MLIWRTLVVLHFRGSYWSMRVPTAWSGIALWATLAELHVRSQLYLCPRKPCRFRSPGLTAVSLTVSKNNSDCDEMHFDAFVCHKYWRLSQCWGAVQAKMSPANWVQCYKRITIMDYHVLTKSSNTIFEDESHYPFVLRIHRRSWQSVMLLRLSQPLLGPIWKAFQIITNWVLTDYDIVQLHIWRGGTPINRLITASSSSRTLHSWFKAVAPYWAIAKLGKRASNWSKIRFRRWYQTKAPIDPVGYEQLLP